MFLSSHEIARSREHALTQLSEFSNLHLEAGQRLSDLMSITGRDFISGLRDHLDQYSDGKTALANQYPAAFWTDHAARGTRLLDGVYEVMADVQKRLIENGEAQVQIVDEIMIASINRIKNTSPWEAVPALLVMRVGLQSAEKTLHDVNQAAIQTVNAAENEMHGISQELLEQPAANKPRPRSRSTKKAA